MLKQSPSQTIGPFFAIEIPREGENVLVQDTTTGQHIMIKGYVWDGDDQPITDAMVEIWQADAQGIYNHPVDTRHEQADQFFRGYGRCGTTPEGLFSFITVKPGPGQPGQAPYVNVYLFARGMLTHALTRLYFSDEKSNQEDPVLNLIDPKRRYTLIAILEESDGLPCYRFDIHLQGEQETVFFV